MLITKRTHIQPIHIPPRLHKKALLMSFENQWYIRKIYKEIIGLNHIDHFSINIVSPNGKMSVISFNPSIIYNMVSDGSYLYNGTISPTFYENIDFYKWDQCYDKRFYKQIKTDVEIKNGIEVGFVIVQRINGFNILFSFASKQKKSDILINAIENNNEFIKIGYHCLDGIKNIYSQYYESQEMFLIKKPAHIKPIHYEPNLIIKKNGDL